jgi:hypothetical protein
MALESATFISQLVSTNPVGATDPKAQGDDHLRLIKGVLQSTFPNATAAINPTPTEFNRLVGVTGPVEDMRGVPENVQAASYTIVAGDAGKVVRLTTGSNVNIPALAANQCTLVINETGAAITLTKTVSGNLRWLNGGNAAPPTGTRTLNAAGVVTLISNGTDVRVFGVGLS